MNSYENRFPAITIRCCNQSQPSDLKSTVEIVLIYKTQFSILSVQFNTNGSN
jgi:hypothetical protein